MRTACGTYLRAPRYTRLSSEKSRKAAEAAVSAGNVTQEARSGECRARSGNQAPRNSPYGLQITCRPLAAGYGKATGSRKREARQRKAGGTEQAGGAKLAAEISSDRASQAGGFGSADDTRWCKEHDYMQ